jgi:hypothetical protein
MQPRIATQQSESREQGRRADLVQIDTRKKRLAAFGLPSRDKAIHYAQAARQYRRTRLHPVRVESAIAGLSIRPRLK